MLRKWIGSYLALVVGVAILGCARTKMTSMPSPDLGGRAFRNIMVFANFSDLSLRLDAELHLAAASVPGAHRFFPSHQLFFPGRVYSQEEVASTLRRNGIEATLVISTSNAGTKTSQSDPTYTTRCTMWSTNGGCQETRTSASGGESAVTLWAQFTAQLFDGTTGKAVWIASASTAGGSGASAKTLIRSMADKSVSQLFADGVIR